MELPEVTRAPGPRGGLLWGSLSGFQRDPIGFLQQATADHGDIVRLRFGPITAHIVNHPDHITHVLSRHADRYDKNTRSVSRIQATCGDSLLSANQTAWARHRQLIQPVFQPNVVAMSQATIVTATDQMLTRWQSNGKATVDIVQDMMALVCRIAARVLFSSDVDAGRIETALADILRDTWRRIQAPFDPAMVSPLFHRKRFKSALSDIDAIVFDIITKRRADKHSSNDVLGLLLAAQNDSDHPPLSDKNLRDAVITLLLAGHETTANALAWSVWHRGTDPEIAQADPAMIFAETLRLYPSIWIIERRAVVADQIAGYDIPKGSIVLISPYLLHRRASVFPDPKKFDPARFSLDAIANRHRYDYLPFGLGLHRCVGLHQAQLIASTVLDHMQKHVTLAPAPDQIALLDPGITLRHAGELFMQPQWR